MFMSSDEKEDRIKSQKAIFKARLIFSSQYHAVSIKEDEDENSAEPEFCRHGCNVCNIDENLLGGAGDVFEVIYLEQKDKDHNVLEGSICGSCLCSLVNGDDDDLDSLEKEDMENIITEREKYSLSLENIEKILLGLVIYQNMTISANGELKAWPINDLMDRIKCHLDEDEVIGLVDKTDGDIISFLAYGHVDLYFNPDGDED